MNARVKAVLSDGLLVTFLSYFTGTIDPFHLGQARPLTPAPLDGHSVGAAGLPAKIVAVRCSASTPASVYNPPNPASLGPARS